MVTYFKLTGLQADDGCRLTGDTWGYFCLGAVGVVASKFYKEKLLMYMKLCKYIQTSHVTCIYMYMYIHVTLHIENSLVGLVDLKN